MTHDEMIEVLLSHKNGGKVQYRNEHHTRCNPNTPWRDFESGYNPIWNFSEILYRARPQEMEPDALLIASYGAKQP